MLLACNHCEGFVPANAFADTLKTCACTTSCTDDCGANVCNGMAATWTCPTCIMTNCAMQNVDCQDN